MARFRPCGMKWWGGTMMGGCGCGWMAWRWRGGCAFANARPGVGFRPKNQNRAFVARFRACRVKRRCGAIMGDGGCGWMAWRLWGGCAFANAKPGVEFRPKTQNRALVARFRACRVKRRRGAMMGDGGCGWMAWRRRGSCAFANARGWGLG
jgi:hypothetical protein